jgi:hypothetical protein
MLESLRVLGLGTTDLQMTIFSLITTLANRIWIKLEVDNVSSAR